jgi:hypothetical protein
MAIKFRFNRKNIGCIAITVFLLPFFLIPAVAAVLSFGIWVCSFLPKSLIILEINTNETVTISTFIYYYTCFLGIEVTGLLSYFVYQLSLDKDSWERREREFEKKRDILRIVNEVFQELSLNLNAYMKKRGTHDNWSFHDKLECQTKTQFNYGSSGNEFKDDKWKKHKAEMEILFVKSFSSEILSRLDHVYENFNEIAIHSDVINLADFSGMTVDVEGCKKELESLLHLLQMI